jgi:hypothetical protein
MKLFATLIMTESNARIILSHQKIGNDCETHLVMSSTRGMIHFGRSRRWSRVPAGIDRSIQHFGVNAG